MTSKITAKRGDSVRVHYTGTLVDGSQFDSSANRDPLQFTVGGAQVLSPFEDAIIGMRVGDLKQIHIPAADGYGEHDPDLLIEFPRSSFPDDITPAVGQDLQMTHQDGTQFSVKVASVTDEIVVLDANHEMAGKDLTFNLELVEIIAPDEIADSE